MSAAANQIAWRRDYRRRFRLYHRQARAGNLGPLACTVTPRLYDWLLREVYDLRFPHVGDERHGLNGRNFDSLQGGFKLRRWLRLAVGRRAA